MLVNKLEPLPRGKARWLVHMEDGTALRVTEAEMVAFSLYTGMELDETMLSALAAAAAVSRARDRALNMISVRPLSRAELIRKLAEKGEGEENLEAVADWLEGLGLLNDSAYAHTVVEHYTAKGYGIYKIKDELYRRGVPRELWEDVLVELNDPAEAIEAFLSNRLKGKVDRKELKKCSDALARRGFAWSDIRDALHRCNIDESED